MEDVARLAGVSLQSVSRVVNAHPHVSTTTRARVESAIRELGYRPNTAARSLARRKSETIGVICSDLSHYGPAGTLIGVQQAARENGYFVSVASVREVNPTSIGDALGHLMEQSLDGVIAIVPHQAAEQPLSTLAKSVPVVAVGLIGNGSLSTVNFDQSTGVRLAVQHLVKLGHSTIAHVSGAPDWADASARIKGWQETLAEKGLPSSLLLRGDWSAASGYLVGVQLAVSRQATAVFAANDQMALGVLRAFAEAGVRVPEDISVVGFDDQPEAAHFLPPLTTVQQDFTELGTRCMKQLLHTMAGENNPTDLLLKPRLIVRSSTDIPTR